MKVTRGGIKLRDHINKNFGGNKAAFATHAGVERLTVFRVVSGRYWKNISVDFAVAVSRATGGRIKVEDFLRDTAVPVDDEVPVLATGTEG